MYSILQRTPFWRWPQ